MAERMRKAILFFMVVIFGLPSVSARAAVTVKKAAAVATKEKSATESVSSLLPTVLNMVQSVQEITQQQKTLTAECIPTSAEIKWVNDMVKEWAKSGAPGPDKVRQSLESKMTRCSSTTGYEASAKTAALVSGQKVCYDWYGSSNDVGMIWYGYPKASIATYCKDGAISCSGTKQEQTVSNIYDIYNLIDFTEQDMTSADYAKATKLIAKVEKCSTAKLSARKRELWSEFLTSSITNVGQTQSTGDVNVLESVSGLVSGFSNSGTGAGKVGSVLTNAAGMLMNR